MGQGLIKRIRPESPMRELIVVPHKGKNITLSFPPFGEDSYSNSRERMQRNYSHPLTGKKISFRPATISESISAAAYEFGSGSEADAKKANLDPTWLQLGYMIQTEDGIWTNTEATYKCIPTGDGDWVYSQKPHENELKSLLNGAKKVNGIYLLNNGIGFAPFESFETGLQDVDTFVRGGLARVLEHTDNKVATKLRKIGSPKFYKEGISVSSRYNYNSLFTSRSLVPFISSNEHFDNNALGVGWGYDVYGGGYAFGVLKENKNNEQELTAKLKQYEQQINQFR